MNDSTNFLQVVDKNNPQPTFPAVENEYADGSETTYVSTTNETTNVMGDRWKTKKDYVNRMNLFNKILYYLWIIVLYKNLPIQRTGHLINDNEFLQTCTGSTYSTYWHWNWWNPLTYVIIVSFILFMFVMNIVISIIQTLKMTNLIQINIQDP